MAPSRPVGVFERPLAFDIMVTAVLAVAGIALLFVQPGDGVRYRTGDAPGVAIVLATTLPLLFRRSAPLGAGVVGAVAALSYLVWDYSAPLATTRRRWPSS